MNRYLLAPRLMASRRSAGALTAPAPQKNRAVDESPAVDRRQPSYGFAPIEGGGEAYNEEAFQYFLDIERRRSATSNRLFLLMLIESRSQGYATQIDEATASKLFPALLKCLRETDFVGWYREGYVAGAVLTHHGEPDREDLPQVVRTRVVAALKRQMPPDPARNLQVRVYRVTPQTHVRRT